MKFSSIRLIAASWCRVRMRLLRPSKDTCASDAEQVTLLGGERHYAQ
jgi:hypothetical protein